MPGLPPKAELKTLIEEAMREKAPALHRELTQSKQLDRALNDRALQAQTSYNQAMTQVSNEALSTTRNLTDQEAISEMMQGRNEAARVALDQAVEFAPEQTDETSERQLAD
jgi:transcription elongation GreA/GreB family factor